MNSAAEPVYGKTGYMSSQSQGKIHVTALLFAGLRERVGTGKVRLTLAAGSSVSDAITALADATDGRFDTSAKFMTALNGDYIEPSAHLRDNDELAIIPPVSGGANSTRDVVTITDKPLNPDTFTQSVTSPNYGAVVTFTGITRRENLNRKVLFLEYEAYQPMAERKIREVVSEMKKRWDIGQVAIGHRTGRVDLGEVSMVVAVSTPHRKDAFEASRYFVDMLKKIVPIWKKEYFEGGEVWIGETPGG